MTVSLSFKLNSCPPRLGFAIWWVNCMYHVMMFANVTFIIFSNHGCT